MGVLIKPIITEKMTADSEMWNRYGFYVDPKANKLEIKKAVEDTYGVTVEKGTYDELRTKAQHTVYKKLVFSTERQTLVRRRSSKLLKEIS